MWVDDKKMEQFIKAALMNCMDLNYYIFNKKFCGDCNECPLDSFENVVRWLSGNNNKDTGLVFVGTCRKIKLDNTELGPGDMFIEGYKIPDKEFNRMNFPLKARKSINCYIGEKIMDLGDDQ